MNLKWLSGDFVAEYARTMKEYRRSQNNIDESFDRHLGALVERETIRLEATIPIEFENGTKVKTYDNKIGEIVGTKIELFMKRGGRDEWQSLVKGPNRYWNLEDPQDESIVTCEGMLRLYNVKFDSHDIEKDWGIEDNTLLMYPDEFEPVLNDNSN